MMHLKVFCASLALVLLFRQGDGKSVEKVELNLDDPKNSNSTPFNEGSYVSRNESEKWSSFPKMTALRDILMLMQQSMNETLARNGSASTSKNAPETGVTEPVTKNDTLERAAKTLVEVLSSNPATADEKDEVQRVMSIEIPKKGGNVASERMAGEDEPETEDDEEPETETVDSKENRKIDRNVDDIILVASNSDLQKENANQTAEENAENARMLKELKAKLNQIGNEGDSELVDEDNSDKEITFDDIIGGGGRHEHRSLDVFDESPTLIDSNGGDDYEPEHRSARSSGPEKKSTENDGKEMMAASESQNFMASASPLVSDFRGASPSVGNIFLQQPNTSHALEEILDLYNPNRLAEKWRIRNRNFKLTQSCEVDTEFYLTALKNGMPWAVKMSDASGKYSSSFFWGNQYWMGSKTLCSQINAPFPLGFSVIRGYLTLHGFDTETRAILVGVCLPSSCIKEDIEILFDWSVRMDPASYERTFEIKQIRAPQQHYNMFEDSTFWLLVIVSSIVGFLMIGATVLDYYLDSPWSDGSVWKQKCFAFDNYSYEIAKTPQHTNILNGEICQNIKIDGANETNLKGDGKNTIPVVENHLVLVDNGGFKMPEIVTDILLAFSVRRNMAQICNGAVDQDTLPTVHGLRALNMAWVILGHTCIIAFKYSDNMEYKRMVEKEFLFQTINNAAFAVDSFFFISGLLVSFLYFRTTARMDVTKITKTTGLKSNCLEFVGLLIYRFGRLTAPYFFMIGVIEVAMKWFYYNSVFEVPADDHINCPNYWWRNILYINTLFPVKDMCMIWSWYLANDTQFYIIGCILLIMAVKRFRTSAVIATFFLVTSWFVTGFIAYTNKHIPNVDDPLALFDKIYDKPWTRFGPYIIGMLVGWILFKTDCTIKFSQKWAVCGWTASIGGLLGLVVGLYRQDLHPVTAAAFSALSHTLWAVCLAWIVIACSIGRGGVVNKFLASPLWYPYSRVTYCAYLVHPIVMRAMVMTRDSPVHLSVLTITVLFWGQLVLSYILSFLLSLAFEAPIVSLLRLISPKKDNKKA